MTCTQAKVTITDDTGEVRATHSGRTMATTCRFAAQLAINLCYAEPERRFYVRDVLGGLRAEVFIGSAGSIIVRTTK